MANPNASLNGGMVMARYAHIVGWGIALPESIVSNDELAAFMETSDDWIRTRTGIEQRYIAGERESTATLGLRAAQQALKVTDILPNELNLIIVATCTPDNAFPSTASLIQNWLGATQAGAFDLSAACSGFVYALEMATQAIRSGSADTVLVIGSETMSRVMDWHDRTTAVLFGDGAGAVVLQASETEGGVLSSVMRSDGSGHDLLILPTLQTHLNSGFKRGKLWMHGGEVFKFATRVIRESVLEAIDKAGITLNDVSLIVPHQANERIIQAAARSLEIDPDRFMSTIDHYANTSAASIPMALHEAVRQQRVHAGDYIVFVGFGGGLSWAAVVIKWGIPRPEARRGSLMSRQRRQFGYAFVRWRNRWQRFRRRITETFHRIRPEYGRIYRLRRKIEEIEDLDDWV